MGNNSETNEVNENNSLNPDLGKELFEAGQRAFTKALQKKQSMDGDVLDPFNMASAYMGAMFSLWRNPSIVLGAQQDYFKKSLELWQYSMNKMMGVESAPVITPKKGDNRWRNQDWSENPVFDYLKQSYLLGAKCVEDLVHGIDDLPEKDAKKLSFFTRQYIDALSPSNSPITNPQVLKTTMEQKGQNLVAGLQNFIEDLEKGDGSLQIAMTDPDAFNLGENVAVTKGKVVFQNRLFQLIQYEPTTEKVYKRPLLIVPPWINKYYVLDLQPKNSMVRWLVDQGHTVFMVSWVNPDESYAETSMEDYMLEGVYAAVDAVERATGENRINLVGFCIGGTLNAATLPHMAGKNDSRISSATFFASLIDFSEPGDLGVFIDDKQISKLEKTSQETGYLDGKMMAKTFNVLRSNDLIWSFYINNYLEGKDPAIFDLLYWNSDSTNLPARMYSDYLRNMYLENNLCKPGGIKLAGVPIDVRNIEIPCYFISSHDDHIAPWMSTYSGARLISGPVRFVLGGSGHIAGIINPPAAKKYCHWTGSAQLPEHPDDWFANSIKHEGSWWPDWHKWLTGLNRAKVTARDPEHGGLEVIEDAPGSYVRKRI
jgi:polyhydroxyalkanoate synthase